MNVVVVEDEQLTAQRLISLLKKYDHAVNVIAQLASVGEAVTWFGANRASVDLIFMDIHLEDGDCFEIVRELNLMTPIIFTTAFDEYMTKAFKVNSVDYLLKPVNFEELSAALNKFKSLRTINASDAPHVQAGLEALMKHLSQPANPPYKERFMVTIGTRIRSVRTDAIAYFCLEDRTVLLVTGDGTSLPIDYSLEKIMSVVDPGRFFRVSRQFILSLNAIQMVHLLPGGRLKVDLLPRTPQDVVVSGDRVAAFKEWLGKD